MEHGTPRVVVGVKGPENYGPALRVAATEARSRSLGLRVVWVVTLPLSGAMGFAPSPNEVARRARRDLDQVVAEARGLVPDLDVEGRVLIGRAQDALFEESREAALLVVGSRMRGPGKSILLGSVSCAVAARAECPVLVVRGPAREISEVVVGTDHSEDGRAAVRYAFGEASRRDVPLRAVHGWEFPSLGAVESWAIMSLDELQRNAQKTLHDALVEPRERHPDVRVESVVDQENPAVLLLDQLTERSLLVVGSRGHGGVSGVLLGSVSQAVLHHAPCPVVVVRRDST